ncbi:V-set and immunoglobulin domain-containing protein 8b isoform 1-T3 [Clarias gariepinus]|uniref:V-set and immunoglobulin domain-containing protein 8b n=1 Tax=Clarias gariepinus TaxID=13013 RepID=UPI00234D6957|nr:V-set and immunoglobulin domain-containing protein 8b [Clarias gariepinus]XP_053360221.1 V-set and immunoglobulin domain-containing protein 8b [Clarias gariepinus]XP_053360222.1 V-set and immunoglobulin domain-containing protein 8b [Clarias gariepinus]
MLRHCTGFRVSLVVLYAISVCLNYAVAIQVTSTGPQTIKQPQGANITLGCTYSESPSDTGQLDVEWSILSPDMTQKDKLILSYSGGNEYKFGDPSLMSRLKFVGDPSRGDASIIISPLRVSDTATYECKVKKLPGIDTRKITLVILVKPSVPKCWVQNGEEIGSTVSLACKSSEGSIPIIYTWTKENGAAMPPTASQSPQTGELLIYNHSQSYTGTYVCAVNNDVGKEQCKYTLSAYNATSKAGIIAGAVIGALLLLLLLLLLIWLLVCCCQKKRYEKETANEIKEDAAAPESRPGSRFSSFRSIMGYHPHQGVTYSSVRNGKPGRADSNKRSFSNSQSQATSQGPITYNSKYGYAV